MKPIFVSLLATLLASSLAGVCQEIGKPEAENATQIETNTSATLPAPYKITDLKGRSMEGTILSKTETAISFVRAADKKKFVIQLDTLSEADKAFVARLKSDANKPAPAALAPGKKASILYFLDWDGTSYEGRYKEEVDWLRTSGYDVTIGYLYSINTDLKSKKTADETAKWVTPLTMMDSYDIVWFPSFRFRDDISNGEEYNFYEVANHRNKHGGIAVFFIPEGNDRKKTFLSHDGRSSVRRRGKDESFVSREDNWIFYWTDIKADVVQNEMAEKSKATTRSRVLQRVESTLAKLKKQ